MSTLDDLVARVAAQPAKQREQFKAAALANMQRMAWVPNPGPQTDAYFSKADVLLYGGEPGGGKSALLLGLAFTQHKRSLIMRRQYTTLTPLIDEALAIHGSREGFNGSAPPKLRIDDERLIEFGAAARSGDEQDWQGNPHDLIGFDEGTQFLEQQVRFLMGWLRSTTPGQRKRVVIATNPPMSAEGLWVVQMFAPWLDERHPRPAKPGELRWFITNKEGKDLEVDGPGPFATWNGEDVRNRSGEPVDGISRTFIPASVADNPFLANTDYQKNLDAMIEPFRSILLGRFKTSIKDDPFQVIPTAWIRAAQERWTPRPPNGVPMCAMGVDPAVGGKDRFTIAPRYDGWYPEPICIPGADIKLGSQGAGHVIANRRNDADIVLDMGGGYGGGTFQTLAENTIKAIAYKGSGKSTRRTSDKKLGFYNKRAELYWMFREALDPDQLGGSPIALPNDPEIVSDLSVLTYEVTPRGIKVLEKEQVVEILGRSPDKGDAIAMAWSSGLRGLIPSGEFGKEQRIPIRYGKQTPKVDLGRRYSSRRN